MEYAHVLSKRSDARSWGEEAVGHRAGERQAAASRDPRCQRARHRVPLGQERALCGPDRPLASAGGAACRKQAAPPLAESSRRTHSLLRAVHRAGASPTQITGALLARGQGQGDHGRVRVCAKQLS